MALQPHLALTLDKTPFQAYTRRIPTLDDLLTFGCHVTPKKAGKRNTATDPNSYNGIFLGFQATQDNIRYWDLQHQRNRHAHHMAKDEVQYGDPPDQRSPASKHLIKVITGTPHEKRRTDTLLDKAVPDEYHTTPLDPHLQLDHHKMTIEDSPLPFTAAAAKAAARHTRKPEETLKPELLLMDMTTNIHEPAVSKTIALQGSHSTLGLVPENHPNMSTQ
jgi:hypothetical protein